MYDVNFCLKYWLYFKSPSLNWSTLNTLLSLKFSEGTSESSLSFRLGDEARRERTLSDSDRRPGDEGQ